MQNNRKQISLLLEEIARDKGYKFKVYSDDWIYQIINNDGMDLFVWGFKFPNNSASASQICDDKAALSLILSEKGIANVEHVYFENSNSPLVDDDGNWLKLVKMLKNYGSLVLKVNDGSGGINVYKCSTMKELEIAYFSIFQHNRAMSVCPFEKIENEFRLVMVDKVPKLVYLKKRPFVIGNGKSSLISLVEKKFGKMKQLSFADLDLAYVPQKGEKYLISWKHNLKTGSMPIKVKNKNLINRLSDIAKNVSEALDLNFASIDIIETVSGEFKVLEVNSGVMLEKFASLSKENYELAKSIYFQAVESYFKSKTINNK